MKINEKIICNCCGKEMKRIDGQYEDYVHLIKRWGYFSKQDGTAEVMDICPTCFEAWTEHFVHEPEHREVTELL